MKNQTMMASLRMPCSYEAPSGNLLTPQVDLNERELWHVYGFIGHSAKGRTLCLYDQPLVAGIEINAVAPLSILFERETLAL